jgi:hypothetical protein
MKKLEIPPIRPAFFYIPTMTKPLLIASVMALALAFIFSCSNSDENPFAEPRLYCVSSIDKTCVPGVFKECPSGAAPKDVCPEGFVEKPASSSSVRGSSSSSSRGSSSSGGGSSSSVDIMSGLPTQVYLDGEEYTGSGDIMLLLGKWEEEETISDTLPAVGRVQNGQITLNNLPESIDSKYLTGYGTEFVSYPNDLSSALGIPCVIISGKLCIFSLVMEHEYWREGYLIYYSKAGSVSGTSEKTVNLTKTHDINISTKGWHITWETESYIEAEGAYNLLYSTTRPAGEWKWIISCDVDL